VLPATAAMGCVRRLEQSYASSTHDRETSSTEVRSRVLFLRKDVRGQRKDLLRVRKEV
jgi:hypothetical protein